MDSRIKIRDAIQAGKITEATAMVHQMYPELLDDDRYLFFHLQQQQLIELIRESKVEEALRFASEQLSERGEESEVVLEELERTLALLAFEDPEKSPYGDLLSYSHRQKVRPQNVWKFHKCHVFLTKNWCLNSDFFSGCQRTQCSHT